jgi:hypothetical protein
MQNLHVNYQGADLTFNQASLMAKAAAASESHMQSPTIVAWHQHSNHAMSPSYDGADPSSFWEKYGSGNGGRLAVTVGDEYDFVMMETGGFETVGQIPVRNLIANDGKEYVCLSPMLGDHGASIEKACVPLDEWIGNQY